MERMDSQSRQAFDADLAAAPAGVDLDPWQRQLRASLGVA